MYNSIKAIESRLNLKSENVGNKDDSFIKKRV